MCTATKKGKGMTSVKKSLEETSEILNNKKKISKFFVHKVIKYSDKKVTEKIKKIEDTDKMKFSKKVIRRISYMNLYI